MSEDTTVETETEAPEAEDEGKLFDRETVQKLRSEAAKHRAAKNQAVQTLEASTAEWTTKFTEANDTIADLSARLSAAELSTHKYAAMIEAGIPTDSMPDIIALVTGNDPDSIAESVAAAKRLMGRQVREPAVDPYQGSCNDMALNSDELEDTLRRAVGA
jgi:hypothetical protein